MSDLIKLSARQLRKAAKIKEQMAALEKKINHLVASAETSIAAKGRKKIGSNTSGPKRFRKKI